MRLGFHRSTACALQHLASIAEGLFTRRPQVPTASYWQRIVFTYSLQYSGCMTYWGDANKLLHNTEKSLRGLIERALADQQYGEVAAIAQMANAIARLTRGSEAGSLGPEDNGLVDGESTEHLPAAPPSGAKVRVRRTARASEFPRFEREGDKLIKVGWSKRDDRVYEHRAPQQVVFLVASTIGSKVHRKGVFTMDRVLPLTDKAGTEIPSYQAYVALAWLRSIGTVKRLGKEGYRLVDGALDLSALQRSWDAIPGR